MKLMKQIESRRAYRAMSDVPIAKDVLVRLVEAAHAAPSSANNQPWRIVTVSDPAKLDALKATLSPGNYWAKKAPAIAAFVTRPEWSMRIGGRDFAYFELGMAAMAYQLQAVEEGLYVHPMAGFNADAAKQVLGIPANAVLEVLVAVAHPGDTAGLSEKHLESEKSPRVRKELDDVSAFDAWQERLVPPPKA